MSSMMKDLIPSNPEADRQALLAAAGKPVGDVPPPKDYVNESAQVAPGSLPLELDLAGLTALAGVKHTPKYLKEDAEVAVAPEGPAPSLLPGITKTKADVGSEEPTVLVQNAIRRAMSGEVMQPKQREAFAPYAKMLERILEEPRLAQMLDNIIKIANREDSAKEPQEEPIVQEPEKTESIVAMLNKQLKEHMEKNNV